MAVRKTLQIGDKQLKAKNRVVRHADIIRVRKIAKDLTDTMLKNNIIGIAAPQIGENYKIIVTEPRRTRARAVNGTDKLRIYINPKIIKYSREENIIYEGCGSVLNGSLFGPVKRPREIIIEAHDLQFQKFRLRCNGILARVIQHEYDHLSGIEFTEKVYDYKKLVNRDFYIKNIRTSLGQTKPSKITVLEHQRIG